MLWKAMYYISWASFFVIFSIYSLCRHFAFTGIAVLAEKGRNHLKTAHSQWVFLHNQHPILYCEQCLPVGLLRPFSHLDKKLLIGLTAK